MRTAIDSNVLSAILLGVPDAGWLAEVLASASSEGALIISGVVYAELSAHPACVNLDDFLGASAIGVRFVTTEPVWRLAVQTFAAYARRRRDSSGGHPKRFLADFLVGAHATLEADRLVTLDADRYRNDFPNLALLPEPGRSGL